MSMRRQYTNNRVAGWLILRPREHAMKCRDIDDRHSPDFSEIRRTLLLNPRWREELQGTGGN